MIVTHSAGSYEVAFTPLAAAKELLPKKCYVVTDENVNAHYQLELPTLVLPPGEQTKSLIWLERVAEWLAASRADRRSTIVALGGGVMGDLVGFAAATFMRGVNYLQIPTTLLAQVDSSVGGKVAVDIPSGKNLIGAFYPPQRVVIDVHTLSTLSPRQRRNGMAEVLKYGFIMDAPLLEDIAEMSDQQMVQRCIEHKARIVAEDEFERTGLRATLNFGHTVGHAIERVTGYKSVLHGEAISIGMVAEAELGEHLGITPIGTSDIVRNHLTRNGLPTKIEGYEPSQLVESMKTDKKASSGELAFSLLTEIGGCKLVENVEDSDVVQALQKL